MPSRAQKISAINDGDSIESPLLQADVERFHMMAFLKAAVLPGAHWWRKLPVWGRVFLPARAHVVLVPWMGWTDAAWLVSAFIILNVVSAGSNISKVRVVWAYSTQVAGS